MHYTISSQLYIKNKKKLCKISKSSLDNTFDSMQSINEKFDELNLSIESSNSEDLKKNNKLRFLKSKSFFDSRKTLDTTDHTFIDFHEKSVNEEENDEAIFNFFKKVKKIFYCF